MKLAISLVVLVASASIYASGWNCSGYNPDLGMGTVRVKLTNKTSAPRTPAILVISNNRYGTLLSVTTEDITKRISGLSTRYSADASEEAKLYTKYAVSSATFRVQYREGVDAPLEDGDIVDGTLVLYAEDSTESIDLTCKRYLKN